MANPTLTYLEQIRHNLEYVEYDLIYKSIAEMSDKCTPTALLNKGWYIDRVRIHKPNENIFTSIDDISYIKNQNVLDNVDFGRANVPKQAVFYGAIESPQIQIPRVVAYVETSDLFKNTNDKDGEEIFTLGRWRILEDIRVFEMIFNEDATKVNDYNKDSQKNQLKNFQGLPFEKHCLEQCRFFSDEFGRKDIDGNAHKYKISAAYANYVWLSTHLRGITYPSVASGYLGQNVALLPEVVDKYMKLERVAMFKASKNGDNKVIRNLKLAEDLGEDCKSFKWQNLAQ